MRAGDFAAAHAISDEVLRARDPAAHDDCNLPYHLRWVWDGRSFDGKDVLVRCYHGLGDTLQFARFLPTLARRTASLHVETQPALVPLLRMLPGPGKLIPFQPASPAAPRACDLEIMELLHALRVMPSTIPPPPVLRVPPLRMAARAIGLCWSAGDWDPARSVPLAQLLAACESPGNAAYQLAARPRRGRGLATPLHQRARPGHRYAADRALDRRARPGHHGRHDGGALGRNARNSGLAAPSAACRLALDAGACGLALVSLDAFVPTSEGGRLGRTARTARGRSQTPGGRFTPMIRTSCS